ncbi:uncharacterized protein V1510DRAFT_421397 [Dipodascopsis tothii]|uniref:uncharacterized protein n=1 Tax=Dipodascopsis tothii TaxID=44089 RepID=UPI0034CF718B
MNFARTLRARSGPTVAVRLCLARMDRAPMRVATTRIPAAAFSVAARVRAPDDHGHSHSIFHSHSHGSENAVLLTGDKNSPAVRITRIGLFVNLSMVIAKGFGGYVFASQALLADAVHALSDLLADFLTLGTVSIALQRPSALWPRGYGKIEALGSLGVAAMLIVAGLGTGVSAGETVLRAAAASTPAIHDALAAINIDFDSVLDAMAAHGHSHGADHAHGHFDGLPDLNAAWLAAGSIGVKEWLFQATMKIAKETKSTVLTANAWHHRVDCLTSVVALAAIGGAHAFNATWIDPVAGLLVSAVILRVGYTSAKQAVLELADHAAPEDVLAELSGTLQSLVSGPRTTEVAADAAALLGNLRIEAVSATKSGPVISADIVLRLVSTVDRPLPPVSLRTANDLTTLVKAHLAATTPNVKIANVNVLDADPEVQHITWVEAAAQAVEHGHESHDHDHERHDHDHDSHDHGHDHNSDHSHDHSHDHGHGHGHTNRH